MKQVMSKCLLLLCYLLSYSSAQSMYHLLEEGEIELHQPSSLQDVCIEKISASLLDIKSYDLEAEKKKLKETLEKVPEPLCQKLIENMEAHLDLQWIYKSCINSWDKEASYFTLIKDLMLYKNNNNVCIVDMSSNPQTTIQFYHNDIRGIFKAPNASLLAVTSTNLVNIFSLKMPIKWITTIPIAHSTALAFSWEEHPKLFIADANNKLSILSNIDSDDYTCTQYEFPESTEISSLRASPNNGYLVATSRLIEQNSYIINLNKDNEPLFQAIQEPICRPCIAPNSSFFAATLYTQKNEPSKSIIYKKSGRTIPINGKVTAVKNNYIFTDQELKLHWNTINVFNPEGILQHSYTINKNIWKTFQDNSLRFLTSHNELYIPEQLTSNDTVRLAFKIIFEKAKKRNNVPMLELLEVKTINPSDKKLVASTIKELKERQANIIESLKNFNRGKKLKKRRIHRAKIIPAMGQEPKKSTHSPLFLRPPKEFLAEKDLP